MLLQEEHLIMKVKTLCMLEDKRYQTLCIQFAINLSRQLITKWKFYLDTEYSDY